MWRAGNWSRLVRNCQIQNVLTYRSTTDILREGAVGRSRARTTRKRADLDSSKSPARTWKKFQESSRDYHSCTYHVGSVALECAVIDRHNGTTLSMDSAALDVACPRRELERKFEIVLLAETARVELQSCANTS
jgi:hypothetical protein